jgi:hypothetical protein
MFLNYTMPHFALRSEADIHNSLHVQSQLMVESISELQRKVNFLTWLEFATRCKNGCVHAKLSPFVLTHAALSQEKSLQEENKVLQKEVGLGCSSRLSHPCTISPSVFL